MAGKRKFKRGYYQPINEHKYIQPKDKTMNKKPIPEYRSSYELQAMRYADANPAIIKWGAECFTIPYIKPTDMQQHRYYIDMYLEFSSGDKFLVEIKPFAETIPPKPPRKSSDKADYYYQLALQTYAVNQAKWSAAKRFGEMNNMKFIILTERELF